MRLLAALPLLLFPTVALAGPTEASCRTAYGQTACGYHCEAAYGQLACTQTPWGACKAAYGKLVCDDGAPWLTWRSAPVERATCTAAYGDVACGWSCTAAYGQVACARTPEGRCQAASGQVTCWDPPAPGGNVQPGVGPAVAIVPGQGPTPVLIAPVPGQQRPAAATDPSTWPEATCRSAYGQTACGYHCEAAYGQVACAQTPSGTCRAAHGQVTCWR